jgi:hypothetical protein
MTMSIPPLKCSKSTSQLRDVLGPPPIPGPNFTIKVIGRQPMDPATRNKTQTPQIHIPIHMGCIPGTSSMSNSIFALPNRSRWVESEPPNAGCHAYRPIAPSAPTVAPCQAFNTHTSNLYTALTLPLTILLDEHRPVFTVQFMKQAEQGRKGSASNYELEPHGGRYR